MALRDIHGVFDHRQRPLAFSLLRYSGEGWGGGWCQTNVASARTAPTLTLPRSTGGGDKASLLKHFHAGLCTVVCLLVMLLVPQTHAADVKLQYPPAPKGDQIDDYHGTKVPDPYRWLEDTDSPQTKQWVRAENEVAGAYLAKLPMREKLRARLTAMWNYPKYRAPSREGSRYFFSKNDGLQNQAVLYVQESLTAPPRVLLDPNTLSKDGTVALASLAFSDDGNLMAYGLAAAGSDWHEIRVRNVADGNDTADHIQWVKFSGRELDEGQQGILLLALSATR